MIPGSGVFRDAPATTHNEETSSHWRVGAVCASCPETRGRVESTPPEVKPSLDHRRLHSFGAQEGCPGSLHAITEVSCRSETHIRQRGCLAT